MSGGATPARPALPAPALPAPALPAPALPAPALPAPALLAPALLAPTDPPLDARYSHIVYWAPSDRGGRQARSLFAAWVAHYPGDGWAPEGTHQQPGFEQFEFNTHLLTRRGVALVPEEEFCSRMATGATPLVHFYGHCQFAGKSSIASFAVQTCAALSREQRRLVPDFTAYVHKVSKQSKSSAAKNFRGDRANSAVGVRRALGQPVKYEGVTYPSLRAVAAATGVHRATITANAEVMKRPACSQRRRRPASSGKLAPSGKPAPSGAKPAPGQRRPQASGASCPRGGAKLAPRRTYLDVSSGSDAKLVPRKRQRES